HPSPNSRHAPHLPSFPTRRSSDLVSCEAQCGAKSRFPPESRSYVAALLRHRRNVTLLSRQDRPRLDSDLPASVHTDRDTPLSSRDRKSTRLNSSHQIISYAVSCLK